MPTKNWMRRLSLLLPAAAALSLWFASDALAQSAAGRGSLPRDLAIASDRPGGGANVIASGLSAIVTKYTPMRGVVKPVGDVTAWINLMEQKEVDMGVTAMTSLGDAYYGRATFKEPRPAYRLVQLGTPQTWAILVPDKEKIETPAELKAYLKGKRFSHRWANPVIDQYNRAAFANLGMTEADIVPVPSATYDQYAAAWSEGRLAASGGTIGVGIFEQMHQARPFRFVSLDPSAEAVQRMRAVEPSTYLSRQEPGPRGVVKAIDTLTYDYGFVVRTDIGSDAVYEVVKALWEHQPELAAIHPLLKNWVPAEKRWVNPTAILPYHAGAIRFYREKGLWTAEMEALQNKLLAQTPKR